jgi:hypothetical protein
MALGPLPHLSFMLLLLPCRFLSPLPLRCLSLCHDLVHPLDHNDKSIAVVALNLLNSRSVQDHPISLDASDSGPVHGCEARRAIPRLGSLGGQLIRLGWIPIERPAPNSTLGGRRRLRFLRLCVFYVSLAPLVRHTGNRKPGAHHDAHAEEYRCHEART